MKKEQLEFIASMQQGDDLGPGAGQYVCWINGDPNATLDGDFTADELEAIAWFMRGGPNTVAPAPHGIAPVLTDEERAALSAEMHPAARPTPEQHAELFSAFPTRLRNALYAEGVFTAEQLKRYYLIDKDTLRRPLVYVPGIAAKSIKRIHDWLKERGDL
jgi:hypothetical protein